MSQELLDEVAEYTASMIGDSLAEHLPDLDWKRIPDPFANFYSIYKAKEGEGRWTLFLLIRSRLSPDFVDGLLGVVRILRSRSKQESKLCFLLVGLEVTGRSGIEAKLEETNLVFHDTDLQGAGSTLMAFLGVEDTRICTPGVSQPHFPIDRLDLGTAPLSAPPPRPGEGAEPAEVPEPAAAKLPEDFTLPALSRPPKPPQPAFEEIATETAELVEWRLREKDLGIQWKPEENPEAYFDLVLLGRKRNQDYRFYVKVFEELSTGNLKEILEYCEALVEIFNKSKVDERHSYLIIGKSILEMSQLYKQIEETNQRLWHPEEERTCRAFVAYLSGLNGLAVTPGLTEVEPALNELRLGQLRHKTSGGRILIVDDDPLALEVLKDTLTKYERKVDMASDGDGFRKAITEGWYSVIILDVNIPEMSGDKMALYVRQFLNPPIPSIILHSGMEEGPLRELASEVGATDFLCKGSSEEHLIEVVKAAEEAYENQA